MIFSTLFTLNSTVNSKRSGVSIVEALLAVTVFGLFATAFTSAIIYAPQVTADSGQRLRATFMAEEGLSAMRVIRERNWSELQPMDSGLTLVDNQWQLSGDGTSDTDGMYTRVMSISTVCRDVSNAITDCPGSYEDANTIQVTASITWTSRFGVERTVTAQQYLTNWYSSEFQQTDWVGGDSQVIWSDETQYDSDDGNIDTATAGQISLVAGGSGTSCGVEQYDFQNAADYTFNDLLVELYNGKAQLVNNGDLIPMEYGTVTTDEAFVEVSLQYSYTDPVVITSTEMVNNTVSISPRVRNVTSNSFEVKLQEALASTETTDVASEVITYIVVEAGVHNINGVPIEAGKINTNKVGSPAGGYSAETINFTQTFSTAPAVFHGVMSYSDVSWIDSWVSRIGNTTNPPNTTGFQIGLLGAQAKSSHGAEDIGWLAIEPTTEASLGNVNITSVVTSDSITGYDAPVTFAFSSLYSSPPTVLVSQQEMDGTDGGWLVTTNLTSNAIQLAALEDQVVDSERSHVNETGAYVALNGGSTLNLGTPDYATSGSIQPTESITVSGSNTYQFSLTSSEPSGTSIGMQLSDDNGSTWQYWDGAAWSEVVDAATDYSTIADVNANLSTFTNSASSLLWRVQFTSDSSSSTPSVDTMRFHCESGWIETFNTPADYTYSTDDVVVQDGAASKVVTGQEYRSLSDLYTTNEVHSGIGLISSAPIADNMILEMTNDGYLHTISVANDGTASVVDSWNFNVDATSGSIEHVSGNIYAIGYVSANDSYIATIEVTSAGVITKSFIDNIRYEGVTGFTSDIHHATGDIYLAYMVGISSKGYSLSFTITNAGDITATGAATLNWDGSDVITPEVYVLADGLHAVVSRNDYGRALIRTISIDGAGNMAVVDSLQIDGNGIMPTLAHVVDDVYVYVFASGEFTKSGKMATLTIDVSTGLISDTVIDTYTHDTVNGQDPTAIEVADNIVLVAYETSGSAGNAKLFEIASDGTINETPLDTLKYDADATNNVFITPIVASSYYYAFVYKDTTNDVITVAPFIVEPVNTYNTADAVIQPASAHTPPLLDTWLTFTETAANDGAAEVYYQLSDDNGSTWQYWNGAAWTEVVGATDYNTASEINDVIGSFSTAGTILWRAFLSSDTYEGVSLDAVSVTYGESYTDDFTTAENYTYTSGLEIVGGAAQYVLGDAYYDSIINAVISNYRYDTGGGLYPDVIKISDHVYISVHEGTSARGYIQAIVVDESSGAVTSPYGMRFDTSGKGYQPKISHISDNIYGIIYRDNLNRPTFITMNINPDGSGMSILDTELVDPSEHFGLSIYSIDDDTVLLGYKDRDAGVGTISTYNVSSLGEISSRVDTWDYSSVADWSVISKMSDNVFLHTFSAAEGPVVATYSVANSGIIEKNMINLEVIDTHMLGYAAHALLSVSDAAAKYALLYPGTDAVGRVITISVNLDGTNIDILDADTIDDGINKNFSAIDAGATGVLFGHSSKVGAADRNYIRLMQIDQNGNIGSIISTWQRLYSSTTDLMHVVDDMYLVVYAGSSNRGEADTFNLNSLGSSVSTELQSIEQVTAFTPDSVVVKWTSFDVSDSLASGTTAFYQLSPDGGSNWYYWSGTEWEVATEVTDYSSEQSVNTHIQEFNSTTGSIAVKAWLQNTNGYGQSTIDSITLQYESYPAGEGGGGAPVTSGELTSSAFEMGDDSTILSIEWDEVIPEECSPIESCNVSIQLRTAPDDAGSPDAANWTGWYGPVDVDTYFDDPATTVTPSALNGNHWLQYRALLEGDGAVAPVLEAVRVRYQ